MLSLSVIVYIPILVFLCDARIHKRFSERHGLSRLMTDRTVPNPSDTTAKLDQIEQTVNSWPAARIAGDISISGVSTSGSINASATATWTNSTIDPEATIGKVTDLEQALKEVQGQSNSGIAQLSGSTAMNSMVIDLLKANISQFRSEVRSNFSRVDGILNQLGDSSVSEDVRTLSKALLQIQAQLGSVTAAGGVAALVQGLSKRISDLGSAVSGLGQRVSALEPSTNITAAQVALASDTTSTDTTLSVVASIPFVLQSWSGRVALAGAVFGIVALVMSIISLSRLPKAPPKPEEAAPEEQVLMEAGEANQVDESQAVGEEYYEGQEGEEQQAQ